MKLLAFSAGGYQINLPGQINNIDTHAGKYGINIIRLAVNVLIYAAVILTLFYIIYAGWKWMTSQGDKKKIEEAQQALIWAIAGLFVVALAFFAVTVLGAFFKVPILTIQ